MANRPRQHVSLVCHWPGPSDPTLGLVAAGVAVIVEAKLSSWQSYIALFLFCIVATAIYIAMELYAGFRPERAQAFLSGIRTWIDTHTDQVIIIVSLALGLWLIGKSIYLIGPERQTPARSTSAVSGRRCAAERRASARQEHRNLTLRTRMSRHRFRRRTRAPLYREEMNDDANVPSGEKRWPMAITLIVAMSLPFLLPTRFSVTPQWVIPVVEGLLLIALVLADPGLIDKGSSAVRGLSLCLVGILVLGATAVTARLVIDLIRGGPDTDSPGQLLRIGSLVLVYIIITFAFLYWELDGGGPEARARATPNFPISPSRSTSTLRSPGQAGDRSSSIICIWPSPTPPRSARPTSCRLPVGRSWRWRSRQPPASRCSVS